MYLNANVMPLQWTWKLFLFVTRYPSKARENVHRTHCYIPAKLAAILDHSPTLVAPLVHAFYLRDPIDLKVKQGEEKNVV